MRRPIASFTTAAVALALAGASSAAAQACLKADSTAAVKITGTLTLVKFVHPGNGSRQQAYVIRLPKPVCADVTDIDDKVQRVTKIGRVQLAGELDAKAVDTLMNKRVTVGGTLFGQHTAYHIAPILVSLKSIDPAK
ncbi:MAG: DUF4431 domain-containing protein [Alphaproteobacteria bacterium]